MAVSVGGLGCPKIFHEIEETLDVINSHVFQKRLENIFNGQKRCHVRLVKTGRDQLARAYIAKRPRLFINRTS
ncbi:MAG: hypothetical protein KZQ62_11505 [Candidatus Thiodiazotropha sp. (ex Lucinoma aequizonata)]|nr:hypothetical protein [Candidatus Thiodiazotropha sp. (ex Lucinoma aequizonata)]MCU7900150.1 hypothetical protein [Candidatus Thiodiazotropha sp. (ex Lucinoma aequizonata)]